MRNFCDRIGALVCALSFVLAFAGLAHAGPYEDALAGFTEGSLSDTAEAIAKVAESGSPLAAPLLQALSEARLQFSAKDKKVFIKTKAGTLIDAATGNEIRDAPPDDI